MAGEQRNHSSAPRLPKKACGYCGAPFYSRQPTTLFCDHECAKKHKALMARIGVRVGPMMIFALQRKDGKRPAGVFSKVTSFAERCRRLLERHSIALLMPQPLDGIDQFKSLEATLVKDAAWRNAKRDRAIKLHGPMPGSQAEPHPDAKS